jgi:hypothetical protein
MGTLEFDDVRDRGDGQRTGVNKLELDDMRDRSDALRTRVSALREGEPAASSEPATSGATTDDDRPRRPADRVASPAGRFREIAAASPGHLGRHRPPSPLSRLDPVLDPAGISLSDAGWRRRADA